MIPFASQRGGGQDLATHLLNEYDNDLAEVEHIRGAVAGDLHGAFKEWEAQAGALTRCQKYLYSLSINPDPEQGPLTHDQYMDYIARVEHSLGLGDQPRAIVFHTKYGREHCHVVWSRIDAEQGRAVHLAFDRQKLMQVTRGFARDYRLALPTGYDQSRQVGQTTLYEKEQERQTGLTKDEHIGIVTEAWHFSDSAPAFVQALAERGYLLATGKRPYVLVDLYGNMNALAKLIDDKSVRTKDLRAFFKDDFPPESLPTVEEAQALAAKHRALIERAVKDEDVAAPLAALKHGHAERRKTLEAEQTALLQRHWVEQMQLRQTHQRQRDELRLEHRHALRQVRRVRAERQPTGLAAFLGKVSGITALRNALHRRDDLAQISRDRQAQEILRQEQVKERHRLEQRHHLQSAEVERRSQGLQKVERRELAALLRDQQAMRRGQARGDGIMPGFPKDSGSPRIENSSPELKQKFQATRFPKNVDVLDAFVRASRDSRGTKTDDDLRSNDPNRPDRPRGDHDRDRQ